MLELEMEPEAEALLERMAVHAGQTKAEFARRAILDRLEDQEDYEIGIAALESSEELPVSLEEVVKSLGLETEFSPQGAETVAKPRQVGANTHSGVSERESSRVARSA